MEHIRINEKKGVENLYLQPNAPRNNTVEYFPCVYIEAGIDFNDVRTGYRGTVKLARALKIHESKKVPGWTDEIIQDANIDRIKDIMPQAARLRPLPEFVDAGYVDAVKNLYFERLTQSWKKILYRNSELDIYSGAGESKEEFIVRCREHFWGQMREELNQMRVIFNRIQEQLKEKYLGISESELSESESITPAANDRAIYSRYAEHIASMFLSAASKNIPTAADTPRMDKNSELEERLIALTADARGKILRLYEDYESKSVFADEYILRPNMRNIRCERSCILWMPRKAM